MRVIDLENINEAMNNETQFVLRCEEVFHDKVSAAAASILSAGSRPIVALTGPSGSGKTTTAMRLKDYLENLGVQVCLLSMDNFFLPLDKRPPEATDWESPYCVNVDLLVSCIGQLMDGKEVDIPWYDFKTGSTGGYNKMQGHKGCIVIAEGIHMLNPLIFDKIRGAATGVYVAPRTRILTKKDRVVRPEQIRVARRLIRDYTTGRFGWWVFFDNAKLFLPRDELMALFPPEFRDIDHSLDAAAAARRDETYLDPDALRNGARANEKGNDE